MLVGQSVSISLMRYLTIFLPWLTTLPLLQSWQLISETSAHASIIAMIFSVFFLKAYMKHIYILNTYTYFWLVYHKTAYLSTSTLNSIYLKSTGKTFILVTIQDI